MTNEETVYQEDELLADMKKLVWTKGDYKIVPYGIIWGSSIYHSQRTFPGAFTMYVFSDEQEDEDTFVIERAARVWAWTSRGRRSRRSTMRIVAAKLRSTSTDNS